jgi:hypothetical protein
MGVMLFVGILGGLFYVKVGVNMKEPGPGIKFKKRGEKRCGDDACQIYARAPPKPPGARLCKRRASQSSECESSDGCDFSETVIIESTVML